MAKRERLWRKTEEKAFRESESEADRKSRDHSLCILWRWQLLYFRHFGLR